MFEGGLLWPAPRAFELSFPGAPCHQPCTVQEGSARVARRDQGTSFPTACARARRERPEAGACGLSSAANLLHKFRVLHRQTVAACDGPGDRRDWSMRPILLGLAGCKYADFAVQEHLAAWGARPSCPPGAAARVRRSRAAVAAAHKAKRWRARRAAPLAHACPLQACGWVTG